MAKIKTQIILSDLPLDEAQATCLVFPLLANEKPLKGLLGQADWRMNGKISLYLEKKRLDGQESEVFLFPCSHRLKSENLLLLGLGQKKDCHEKSFRKALLKLTLTLGKSRIHSFILCLNGILSAEDQAQWMAAFWLDPDEAALPYLPKSWTILGASKPLKAFEKVMAKRFAKELNIRSNLTPQPEKPQPFSQG